MMPVPLKGRKGAGRVRAGGGQSQERLDRNGGGPYPARVRKLSIVAVALLFTGCAGTHGGPRVVPLPLSDQHERIIGSRLAKLFETGLQPQPDPRVDDYVNQLAQRIARLSDRPEIPYTVRVFIAPDPQAIGFPGGMIYVSTGLLQRIDTESEAAGVLGHEIAHIASRHASGVLEQGLTDPQLAAILADSKGADSSRATAKGLQMFQMGYNINAETSADVTAMLYVSRAGMNPDGMIQVMEKLNPVNATKEEFWEPRNGSHLPMLQRILSLRTDLKSMGLDAGLPNDQHPYAPIKKLLK